MRVFSAEKGRYICVSMSVGNPNPSSNPSLSYKHFGVLLQARRGGGRAAKHFTAVLLLIAAVATAVPTERFVIVAYLVLCAHETALIVFVPRAVVNSSVSPFAPALGIAALLPIVAVVQAASGTSVASFVVKVTARVLQAAVVRVVQLVYPLAVAVVICVVEIAEAPR